MVLASVFGPQVGPICPNLGDIIQRQGLIVHFYAFDERFHPIYDLVTNGQLDK